MKKIILLPFLLFFAANISAQLVNEQVRFDNPNDLSDHFYGMQSLVQIPLYGVTGGCLQVPDSNNWGNDNSRYCSKFKAQDSAEYTASFLFKYSDSVMNPNSFDRAASVWMQPFLDPNHYIIASFNHDKKLELITYSSADYSSALSLTNNNWYELSMTVLINGNNLLMNLMLVDRGANGQMPPIPVDFVGNTISDSIFARDNAIEVSIIGSKYGGSIYIDDFNFTGIKSADSCLTSGITSESNYEIKLITEGNYLIIKSDRLLNEKYEIYDIMGKRVLTGTASSDDSIIDISKLKSGSYILRLADSRKSFRFNASN